MIKNLYVVYSVSYHQPHVRDEDLWAILVDATERALFETIRVAMRVRWPHGYNTTQQVRIKISGQDIFLMRGYFSGTITKVKIMAYEMPHEIAIRLHGPFEHWTMARYGRE